MLGFAEAVLGAPVAEDSGDSRFWGNPLTSGGGSVQLARDWHPMA
jgi:hypothetical protein